MSSGKKKLIALLLLLLAVAIPASVYLVLQQQEIRGRAEPATTLAFDPPELRKTVGETFTLNVNIDTGSNFVSGAELHIQYDTTKLTAIGIDIAGSPFLPRVLVQGSAQGGFAFITLGSQPSDPKRGTGTLATVTFRATASTAGAPTFVRFTDDTAVAGTREAGDVLASRPAAASVIIGPATTPIPTSSPTPTPTPTAGAGGPTPTPRGIGAALPTPTTTRIATSAAVPTAIPTPFTKGPITPLPTTAAVPVTAEVGPTTVLTIGGVLLFVAGVVSLLAL